jgi:hypothetical protein
MAKNYTVEVQGEARELYAIEADSPEEARQIFESGKSGKAYLTEVSGASVVEVTEDNE